MIKLTSVFRKKALEEVNEDESRKEQSLKQFREWIAKHPFIKRVRTGQKFFKKIYFYFIRTRACKNMVSIYIKVFVEKSTKLICDLEGCIDTI